MIQVEENEGMRERFLQFEISAVIKRIGLHNEKPNMKPVPPQTHKN